jgi:fucokinase
MAVLQRELSGSPAGLSRPMAWLGVLSRLRILIWHAGGAARRLPAYGPCGKLFVPLPDSHDAFGTLFDRQLPIFAALPSVPPAHSQGHFRCPPRAGGGWHPHIPPSAGSGQVVIVPCDVLVDFHPAGVRIARQGVTGLGCWAPAACAANHGVYQVGHGGQVEVFLQKPTPRQQSEYGILDRDGRAVLDVGVMSLDAATAVKLLEMFQPRTDRNAQLAWSGEIAGATIRHGLDFYREVACALGRRTTLHDYLTSARTSGSVWKKPQLVQVFRRLREVPFSVDVLPDCRFLHFGTTRQLVDSGAELVRHSSQGRPLAAYLDVNNQLGPAGRRPLLRSGARAASAWVEGCQIRAHLALEGENVVTGVDVQKALALPRRACLDVVPGRSRSGDRVFFVRCYHIDDTFRESGDGAAVYCGRPIDEWLQALGVGPEDVWDAEIPPAARNVFRARLIVAERASTGFRRWLWTFDPSRASPAQRAAWLAADRYSFSEVTSLADPESFYRRRAGIRAGQMWQSLPRLFTRESLFSAAELAHLAAHTSDLTGGVGGYLAEAHRSFEEHPAGAGLESLVFPRMMHTLGSALRQLPQSDQTPVAQLLPGLAQALPGKVAGWIQGSGLTPGAGVTVTQWARRAQAIALASLKSTILASGARPEMPPRNALRADEIVWGRAPARLDLSGGWTDTPPYTLEFGGCVLNAAVDLGGQPPVQAFARVAEQPIIRISSIDRGASLVIKEFQQLNDFADVSSEFSLAKAALVLSGFSPGGADGGRSSSLSEMLKAFGGGVELTTLAAVPKGSGLGTSSIMGAVLLSVLARVLGRPLAGDELFHAVLQLEQMLTTGGGWQDQIGGAVDGLKLVRTSPGMVPQPEIAFIPYDVLEPADNGGQTLLYYTGITRLAKNILTKVVGRYLDRQRSAMAALAQIGELAPHTAAAMARRDLAAFGECIHEAWSLNKQLDPDSTSPQVEEIMARVRPYVYGAKLLGAGGGGFLLLVCKSPDAATKIRADLEARPPNPRARFFELHVNLEGLRVTTC